MILIPKIASYMVWANDVIWEIVKELNDEEYNHVFYNTGGSIRLRYIHLELMTLE